MNNHIHVQSKKLLGAVYVQGRGPLHLTIFSLPIMSLSYSQGSWGHIELLPIMDSRDLAKFGDTLFTLQIICKIPILSLSELWTPINADREVINYLTFGHRMPPATIPHNCLSQTTPIAAACRE